MKIVLSSALKRRFWSQVDRDGPGGCWLWTGGTCGSRRYGCEYGRIYVERRRFYAHRIAWLLHGGSLLEGEHVLHRCDVGLCVRRSHLFKGTHAVNMRDMAMKGRAPWFGKTRPEMSGEKHPMARLTRRQVEEIRRAMARGEPQREVARRFGVSQSTAWRTGNMKSWRYA